MKVSLFGHLLAHSCTNPAISQSLTPRIEPPEVMPQKPVVPGPNSWALAATQGDPKKLPQPVQGTNRAKYEQKPMPPTPGKASSKDELLVPKNRGYVQPATPHVYPNQSIQSSKGRAATDPVIPQPLFAGTKPSGIAQLRQKLSGSKAHVNALTEHNAAQLPSSSPGSSEKPLQIPGAMSGSDNSGRTPPAAAPLTADLPEPHRVSDGSSKSVASNSRQIQSIPAPTRGHLMENGPQTPRLAYASLAATVEMPEDSEAPEHRSANPEGITVGSNMLNPSRTGAYGRVGAAQYVKGHENQRVASCVAVIENTESLDQTSATQHPYTSQEYNSAGLLPPTVYSPGNFGGVWENDPDVGHTLPIFSPMKPHHRQDPEMQMRESSQGSDTTVPMVLQAYYPPPSRTPAYYPSSSSINSWVASSQGSLGNSFATTDPPPSARMRAQGPVQGMVNAAPTPPYPGFQPSTPMAAAFAQQELTLHHHMESCFGSVSRLIIDKQDRSTDQIIRRLENSEEMIGKGQKSGKDIRDIKKDVGVLKAEVKDSVKRSDIKDLIKALNDKIAMLEKKVENCGCKCQHASLDTSVSELEGSRAQQASHLHQRVESVQASENTMQRQPHQSAASRSSGGRHQSGNSSRARSNIMSGGGQGSAPGSSKKEYLKNLGAGKGSAPDLRNHPAFADVQQQHRQVFDANGMPVGLGVSDAASIQPSLSQDWYQQSFGH